MAALTSPARARLSSDALRRVNASLLPSYDRTIAPVVAHIGVGAFARAHLGVFADDLAHRGTPLLIRGVSLRSRRAQEQLAPQDCLYTVTEMGADGAELPRVLGAFTSVGTGSAKAVAAITAPETVLVTLTVTEKGYELSRADLVRPEEPTSAPGVIALALVQRHRAGLRPPVIAPLDNMLQNGNVLRRAVVEFAAHLDPEVAQWIDHHVAFPSSVVDRLVPSATEKDLADVSDTLGLYDEAAVTTEHHRSWVMTAVDGLPPLADVGVELVDDTTPYERRKLWLLNGPHSALAYMGLVTGCQTISEAAAHPVVSRFVGRLVDEIIRVIRLPASAAARPFADEALVRFGNTGLNHTCAQVASDGSRKLPERFGSVIRDRHARGLATERFAMVAAVWIAATTGYPIRGAPLPMLDDPEAAQLKAAAAKGDDALVHAALGGWSDVSFRRETVTALRLLARGGRAALSEGP